MRAALSRLARGSARLVGRVALAAVATLLALLPLELGVRWLAPQQLIVLRPDLWIPADGLGWRHAPRLDTIVNTGERDVRLITDEHGYRVSSKRRVGPVGHRVLALGDSFIAALQVEYEDSVSGRLELGLSDSLPRAVEVVNTAVGGYEPSHYLLQTHRELARSAYDLVLVFVYLGNDIQERKVERFPPRESGGRPLRWPRRLSHGELVDAWAYPLNTFLEARSHLYVLAKSRLWRLLMRAGLSARRFYDPLLASAAESPRWAITASVCAEIAAAAQRHGARSLFVLLPAAGQVDERLARSYAEALGIDWGEVRLDQPSRLLLPEMKRRGLMVVDTTSFLRERAKVDPRPLFGSVDTHFSAAGHAAVAELLEPLIVPLLNDSGAPPNADVE